MKSKNIFFSLVIFGGLFASQAQAGGLPDLPDGTSLECGPAFHDAFYFKWGDKMVANLQDGFVSTQYIDPDGETAFLACGGVASSFKCDGSWGKKSASVTFTESSAGQYYATFLPYYNSSNGPVTFLCHEVKN